MAKIKMNQPELDYDLNPIMVIKRILTVNLSLMKSTSLCWFPKH